MSQQPHFWDIDFLFRFLFVSLWLRQTTKGKIFCLSVFRAMGRMRKRRLFMWTVKKGLATRLKVDVQTLHWPSFQARLPQGNILPPQPWSLSPTEHRKLGAKCWHTYLWEAFHIYAMKHLRLSLWSMGHLEVCCFQVHSDVWITSAVGSRGTFRTHLLKSYLLFWYSFHLGLWGVIRSWGQCSHMCC